MCEDGLVHPLYEREPDSVPGPFYVVKGMCLLCALPPETAPENVQWDEQFQRAACSGCPNHCRVVRQPETPHEADSLIEAAVGSCVEAIRYCGTDPEILTRLRKNGYERLCDALCTK
jgi:hypothetical protein